MNVGFAGGTRFRLFPQIDEGMAPELVAVSSPAGSLGPGPADARMHVVDPVDKTEPYDPPSQMPPWRGPTHQAARAGPGGHFDHLAPGTPHFSRRICSEWCAIRSISGSVIWATASAGGTPTNFPAWS